MDRHFRLADGADNICLLAAFADQLYANRLGCQTRAVFAYDERLRLLPDYLQQLEMESNGKSVTFDGQPLAQQTAPITWGGVGRSEEHTSELQSLMRISYAVFCLKKKNNKKPQQQPTNQQKTHN